MECLFNPFRDRDGNPGLLGKCRPPLNRFQNISDHGGDFGVLEVEFRSHTEDMVTRRISPFPGNCHRMLSTRPVGVGKIIGRSDPP